jgi:pantoate--beta-alanine ligase
MKVFHHASDLRAYLSNLRTNNRSVGFVPTMGALHQGHRSLVELSQKDNQVTVVSIFVNPTQFNNAEDLEKYPRTPGKDLEYLAMVGCEVVFLPTVAEVYPAEPATEPEAPMQFGSLETVMEGAMRPGHFAGVAQVVKRLLELTRPDRLYMGQKDYQQVAIIRAMLRQTGLEVKLVIGPTIREDDGLALSSRNLRLSTQARRWAPELHQSIQQLKTEVLAGTPIKTISSRSADLLRAIPGFRVEYVEVFNGDSLQPITELNEAESVVVALAVWAGDVRLIDNIIIR